ncbi:MAG: tetratricopeptide repeat protein [Gemmatimonadaceae bacterium]
MTGSGAEGSGFEDRTQALFDWTSSHTREVTIGVAMVAVVVAASWLYSRTRVVRAENASKALAGAENSIAAGNAKLAQSDLEKLVRTFDGTPAAKQGALLLAEVQYEQGRFQPGIDALKGLSSSSDRFLAASAENLTGVGYEELGKFADAAQHYRLAADKAEYRADHDNYMANAARAYTTGGNLAEAKRIWSLLAADPRGPVAAEARVRLGELEATGATKG